jgi:hypothetical protein
MLPFRSLNAGEFGGLSADLESAVASFTYTVQLINVVTGGVVMLQGSLDGENWVTLDSVDLVGADQLQIKSLVSDHAVRYVRAYADSLVGSSPRVTVYIAPRPVEC